MTTYPSTQYIHQTITDQVISAIKAGAPKFEMPWHTDNSRPVNVASGNPYRGVNTLALWIAKENYGYETNTWGTYKQWNSLGAQVRKGERAATVVFYKEGERLVDEEIKKSNRYFIATANWVFNADQVTGYTALDEPLMDKTKVLNHVEEFIAATGARISASGVRACYNLTLDTIMMPQRVLFRGSSTRDATESYYSTLLHELTHWTGHPSRLNRELKNRFGDLAYAVEELVAELGAAFLCADLGITLTPRPDHAAYIQGWLDVLKQDKKAIFTAASRASAASDYLFKLKSQAIAA
jgi:antirestriction protein ArdC